MRSRNLKNRTNIKNNRKWHPCPYMFVGVIARGGLILVQPHGLTNPSCSRNTTDGTSTFWSSTTLCYYCYPCYSCYYRCYCLLLPVLVVCHVVLLTVAVDDQPVCFLSVRVALIPSRWRSCGGLTTAIGHKQSGGTSRNIGAGC